MTDEIEAIKNLIQSRIPQIVASMPLVTCEDDLSPQGVLASYIYKVCRIQGDSDEEKLTFWKQWKRSVYKMMRVRKNYISRTIRKKTVRELQKNMSFADCQCIWREF